MANSLQTLQWVKSQSGGWLDLQLVHLSNVVAEGVYVIFKSGAPGAVVRVGQGTISTRLSAHRNDPSILRHKPPVGRLFVTWASVPAQYRDGVERYLAELYRPLEGDRFPDAQTIAVNAPA